MSYSKPENHSIQETSAPPAEATPEAWLSRPNWFGLGIPAGTPSNIFVFREVGGGRLGDVRFFRPRLCPGEA